MPPRRGVLVDALHRHHLTVLGDDAGSHVVVPLPSAVAETRVIAAARRTGVLLDGLARHHLGPQHTFGIPLGYAALSLPDLQLAARAAAQCLADG
jgi:GntR family transcriptional regulator/MocR family aminotransferase